MGQLSTNQVIGIVLLVAGALMLLGFLDLPLAELAGLVLIVVGILILAGKLAGPMWLGVLLLVLGILVFLPWVPVVGDVIRGLGALLEIAIAIVLIILGVLKLTGR